MLWMKRPFHSTVSDIVLGSLLLVLSSLNGYAQQEATRLIKVEEGAERIVVAHANGERDDAVKFIWDKQGVGFYEMLALSRTGVFPAVAVNTVLKAAIGGYLDTQIKFGSDGVRSDVAAVELAQDMESIVNSLLSTTSLATTDLAFSDKTKSVLQRLTSIDWSNTAHALEGNPDEDKYVAIYRFVRAQREELEQSITDDLTVLNELWIRGQHVFVSNVSDATVCGTVFDEDKYLCALDLQMNEVFVHDSQPGLSLTLVPEQNLIPVLPPEESVTSKETVKVRKRDRWLRDELLRLNERMDKLDNTKEVLAVRDRIDAIEDRISSIESELEEVKKRVPAYDNPISNLSELTGKNITIRFASGSTNISSEYMVLLNEVFEHLARSPEQRILITGYSDKSGNADRNLELSEQRARAVREHLLARGISSNRVLVNYYGESKSLRFNAEERRVEIEWLP